MSVAQLGGFSHKDAWASWTTLSILLVIFYPAGVSTADTCTFASRPYTIGEVWYPRLGQPGAQNCVACICQEGGKMNCTIHQCSTDCTGPAAITNECCKYCTKSTKQTAATLLVGGTSPMAAALRPAPPAFSTTQSNEANDASCLHSGQVFKNKEKFTSNSIGLQVDHSNQCIQCVCENGMVLCQLKECPKVDCPNAIRVTDDCCPVCPDEAGRIDEMENSPVVISQPSSSKMEDCISGGRYYLHGSTWHPVMGPFGPMDCVICQCRSGRIECHRLECPQRMPCEKPVKVTGRCCPVCPLETEMQGTAASPSSKMFNTASQQRSELVCLPANLDVVVYRAQGGGNSSEFIQYIFQRVPPTGVKNTGPGFIEHHLWMIQTAGITYKVQDLTKDQMIALKQRFRFHTIGASSTKDLRKFTRREKKLKPKCGTGCQKKIRRLERNLSLKQPFDRKICLPGETEVLYVGESLWREVKKVKMRPDIKDLEEALEDENVILTYKWLSLSFGVPVNEAKSILEDFAASKRPGTLSITFCLYGVPVSEANKITVLLARQEEKELAAKKFVRIVGEHIYSVSKTQLKGLHTLYNTDVDLVRQNIPVLNQYSAIASLAKYRSKEEIPRAGTRTDHSVKEVVEKKLNGLPSSAPAPNRSSGSAKRESEKEELVEIKKGEKHDPKLAISHGKKLGGLASMFQKQQEHPITYKKVEKRENEKEEEEKKIEIRKTQSEKAPVKRKSSAKEKNAERASTKLVKSKSSKHVGSSDDDEEMPVPKRRKRVVVESDSESEAEVRVDSDHEEEPIPPPLATSSTQEVESSQSQSSRGRRMKLVDKTYMDEEGYIVTKKEMEPVEGSDEEIADAPAPAPVEKASTVSPPKAPPLKKKQASIMSFFKKK